MDPFSSRRTTGDRSMAVASHAPFGSREQRPGNGGNLSFPTMLTSSKYFADNFLVSTPVPEPRTWTLVALGIGAIGAALRLSRRAAATTLQVAYP